MRFVLQRVDLMPAQLDSGVLYYSEKYKIAIHLCACGCGTKIKTPIHPAAWSVVETSDGPTLNPSVGNWQEECKSHYVIERGEAIPYRRWSHEEITEGRRAEQERREQYFAKRTIKIGVFQRIWQFVSGFFSRLKKPP